MIDPFLASAAHIIAGHAIPMDYAIVGMPFVVVCGIIGACIAVLWS